ncbi:hypothetical protein [Streptomyces sp. CB01881]|uniref:hypothetical protein n=1 Tax=Streptomyces sp. CB01881 TaxID=2078691 RepID=UPI001F11EBBB|nr:hypothetical protein [Streptomyces sp. CB01881]
MPDEQGAEPVQRLRVPGAHRQVDHLAGIGVQVEEQARPGRRAERLGAVRLAVVGAGGGQRVHVRRGEVRIAGRAHGVGGLLVRQDDEDVGTVRAVGLAGAVGTVLPVGAAGAVGTVVGCRHGQAIRS